MSETKLLTLDEVAEIEREPWMHSYGDDREEAPLQTRRVAITVGQRDALCATVRALEAELTRVPQARSALMQLDELRAANDRAAEALAAVTQENESLEADNKMLEGVVVERDLLQGQLVAVTEDLARTQQHRNDLIEQLNKGNS